MLVQAKRLQYWKTEHQNMDGCQDACELVPERGVFAVADGAGTTLFPALWARILARHFVDIPLMSDDPFEIEWWVRIAQEQYKKEAPGLEHLLDWSVRAKAQNQGSDSTLATLRISSVDPTTAQAELLVFGDSCVIIGNTKTKSIERSFVYQHPDEFVQAPICVPSTLRFFNRHFHRCSIDTFTLGPQHIVIIASDAVAKWILSKGDGRFDTVWTSFYEVFNVQEEHWRDFIEDCRTHKEMVNDDSTALILTFTEDGNGEGEALTPTTSHAYHVNRGGDEIDVLEERKLAFQKARQDDNKEMVAIYFGDGRDLKPFVSNDVTVEQIQHARAVADALAEVLHAFRQAQNTPNLPEKIGPVWQRCRALLEHEKCAENIRKTLQNNGVNLAAPQLPPASASSELPEWLPSAEQPVSTIVLTEKRVSPVGSPSSMHEAELAKTQQELAITEQELERERREGEKLRLENNFYRAPGVEELVNAADAIEAARFRIPDLMQFSSNENGRIEQARNYIEAREKLRIALQRGILKEIVDAANDPLLSNLRHLSQAEQDRVVRAIQLVEAFQNEDDVILAEIEEKDYQLFNFTEMELILLSDAQLRYDSLQALRAELNRGRLFNIAQVYHPILDTSKSLNEDEREIVQLAQKYRDACIAGDDEMLVETYHKIEQTGYGSRIEPDDEEYNRIHEAESRVQRIQQVSNMVVATVGNQKITLTMLWQVCRIKELYVDLKITKLQGQTSDDFDTTVKLQRDQQIESPSIAALDDLIDNVLIRAAINNKQQGYAHVEDRVERALQGHLEELRNYINAHYSDYALFLKQNRLTDEDIVKIVRLLDRRELFKEHYQPKLLTNSFEKWLDKERKRAKVEYTEDGEDEGQRATWFRGLLDQLR
jgi:hypothetical protein